MGLEQEAADSDDGCVWPYRAGVFGPVHVFSVRLQRTLQQCDIMAEIQLSLMLRGEAGISQIEDQRSSVGSPPRITLLNAWAE